MAQEQWNQIFRSKAMELQNGDTWNLEFDDNIVINSPTAGWHQYIKKANARFACTTCRRCWQSKAMVLFHMRLENGTGTVKVRRFRQRCHRCTDAPMVIPDFELNSINILLDKLIENIRKKCYNEDLGEQPRFFRGYEVKNPHEKCEGCINGCCDYYIKRLGGLPYASLLATILCLTGLALFCSCGHIALTNTLTLVETYFSTSVGDHVSLTNMIDVFLYCIYGIATFFFVYSIVLLSEGFYTTRAIKKELQSDFKTTFFGRCITALFALLSYILALTFIGVFGFTCIPFFLYYNMQKTCDSIAAAAATTVADGTDTLANSICVDVRQYGIIPWTATPGKACGDDLIKICDTTEFFLSYHLYMVALAGAAATVISLIHNLMANWAYLKSAAATHAYQDVEAEARSKEGQNSSYS